MKSTQSLPGSFNSKLFWTASLAYVLLFIRFYPPIYAFRDEGIYLSLAEVFKAGTVFIEKTGIPVSIYIILKGHQLPFYPPGNPLLLIPFTWFGLKSIFALGLCFHLLSTYLFRKLAKIFDCDYPVTWLLYLFFPSFVFYSRTLMSDIPSLTIFLAAFYFYFRPLPAKGLSGFFFGLSLLFRTSNVIVILPFFAGLCLPLRKRRGRELLSFCAAAAPFAVAIGLYNTFIYGSPFLSGYSEVFTGVKNFSLSFFPGNAAHYLITLNAVYPFMMFLFLFNRSLARFETVLLTFLLFTFFGFYYFHDHYPQPLMDFVFGNRFFYPAIPFFIMGFAKPIQDRSLSLPSLSQKGLAFILTGFLLAGSTAIHMKHQVYLDQQAGERDLLYENTREGDALIYDGTAAELIQSHWGKRHYLPFETYGGLVTALNNLPPHTDIYMVIRNTSHGKTEIRGSLFLNLKIIKETYRLKIVAKKNEMILYQMSPREDIHAFS